MEDRRRRACRFRGRPARGLLKYLEDSGDLKVSVTELQEKLGISEEAGVPIKQVAQQARNENGRKIFEIFSRGEEDVCIASWASWNAQLKGLAELKKRCPNMRQEVKLLSERQEISNCMVEDRNQVAEQSNGKSITSKILRR